MEQKSKKLFSTILMSVGALFIIVAGGIFVSTTWQYIPEELKKLCLAVVTGGLFAGSYIARSKYDLNKTATAFYYLGICFTGFTTYSLVNMFGFDSNINLAITFATMSVPVALHFFEHHNLVDSIFQILLLDGMVLCVTDAVDTDNFCILLLSASMIAMLLSAFICYCRRSIPEETAVFCVAITAYAIHAFLCLPLSIVAIVTEEGFFFSVLPVIFLVASVSFIYKYFNSFAIRVLQSIAIFYLSLSVCAYIYFTFFASYCAEFIFFGAFVMNLIWMFVLNRKEMFYINAGFISFYAFLQLGYYALWGYSASSVYYFPYTIVMAIALVLWKYLRQPELESGSVYRFAFIWLYMGLNAFLAMEFKSYSENFSFAFWFALLFLQIGILCKEYVSLQAAMRTIALAVSLVALLSNQLVDMCFYTNGGSTLWADFSVEYNCTLIGLAIVLLGVIWYHNKNWIRIPQFVMTCILLVVLLLHNIDIEALPNVMFLGIVSLIILVLSTVLNRKNYAIASAATLILIVLYLSRSVWASIAWWVYLFVAGVGLVIYAIKREKAE